MSSIFGAEKHCKSLHLRGIYGFMETLILSDISSCNFFFFCIDNDKTTYTHELAVVNYITFFLFVIVCWWMGDFFVFFFFLSLRSVKISTQFLWLFRVIFLLPWIHCSQTRRAAISIHLNGLHKNNGIRCLQCNTCHQKSLS